MHTKSRFTLNEGIQDRFKTLKSKRIAKQKNKFNNDFNKGILRSGLNKRQALATTRIEYHLSFIYQCILQGSLLISMVFHS